MNDDDKSFLINEIKFARKLCGEIKKYVPSR